MISNSEVLSLLPFLFTATVVIPKIMMTIILCHPKIKRNKTLIKVPEFILRLLAVLYYLHFIAYNLHMELTPAKIESHFLLTVRLPRPATAINIYMVWKRHY